MAHAHPVRPGALASFGISAGPRYGEQIPVPAPVVTIGKAAECDLVLDDDSVSARHARLEFDVGGWRLTDLASTNGTAVEGVKLAPNVPTPIPYGATVRFGGVKLHFLEAVDADPAQARQAYEPPAPKTTLKEERSGFRFPVWLLVLVLVVLAVVAWLVFAGPATQTPAPTPLPSGAPAAQAGP
ncbi:MAG TPA: FHA domain-containing protein [Longimicrobium sp.]|nr:FHA domain-containing protein [Longimicrobium sp.]